MRIKRSGKWLLLSIIVATLMPSAAVAQRRSTVGNQGPSVTLQLPSFHYFGTSTSVLVPDRGAVSTGGINRSSYNSRARGAPLFPWANRAISRGTGAANTSVHAWIHDPQAMDEALLSEAARRRGGGGDAEPAAHRKADSRAKPTPVLVSTEEFQRRQSAAQAKLQAEAARHLAKAQDLLAEGKPGVAKIYFRMALRRAEEPLRAEIAAQMAELNGANVASGK